MASASVLLAGFIVGTYCVQLRGPGWAALLANGRLTELVLVGGAIAALAVVVHLSVFRAMAGARAPVSVRSMLRRALELLETDGEASEAYTELPQEVRDLVGLFEAQRTREQQIEREKQRLREELQGLAQQLERSVATLEPLPTSGAGEAAQRIAHAWNQIVTQVQRTPAVPNLPMPTASPPVSAPAEYPAWAGNVALASTAPAPAMTDRLQELESRLAVLQNEMRALHSLRVEAAPAPALFAPESDPEPARADALTPLAPEFASPAVAFTPPPVEFAPPSVAFAPPSVTFTPPTVPLAQAVEPFESSHTKDAGPGAPLLLMPDPMFLEPEAELEDDPESAASTWTDVVPAAVPWAPTVPVGAIPEDTAFDLPLPEPEALTPAAPTPEEELRWARSEVLQPTRPTKASESGYFEWTGASTQRGSWKLRDEATEELTGETPSRAAAPTPAVVTREAAPPSAAPTSPRSAAAPQPATPVSQSFENYFPHFVGKPVGDLEGRVAVSFEGKSTTAAAPPRTATPGLENASDASAPAGPDAGRRPWRPTEYDT